MSDNPNSPAAIESSLQGVFALLAKGAFVEAMETYLADDVVLQEANADEKRGKVFCIDAEKTLLEGVKEFHRYEVLRHGTGEGVSFYEAIMEFTTTGDERVSIEQAVVTQWRDGKIAHERYYHA
ncbi:MAG: hypothetical protein ACKVI3_08750 [Verrucomicrobiia bacterium]|tara:strand:- start:3511 stop:3882 length:372 start_codon:yes stop_codon:yes gene_type:complete